MNGKEISDKVRELNSVDNVTCTDIELKDFMQYGIILQSGDKYYTRTGKQLDIDVIKTKTYKFNLDLSSYISNAIAISSIEKINKIYYMTQETYNKYLEQKLIISKNNNDYYRLFEGEIWRVVIV